MKSLVVVVSRRLMAVSTSGATSHTYTHISCTTRLFPFFSAGVGEMAFAHLQSKHIHTTHTLAHTYILRCPPHSRPVVFIWLGIPQSLLFAAKGPFSSSAGTVVESRSQKQAHVNVHTNVDWRGVKRGRGTKVFLFCPFVKEGEDCAGREFPDVYLLVGARGKIKVYTVLFRGCQDENKLNKRQLGGWGGANAKKDASTGGSFQKS